jgi:hypothetical protein
MRFVEDAARFGGNAIHDAKRRNANLHEERTMPEKKVIDRAKKDARQGKSPSTQAGEFVREEFEHIREGKHGARSSKQAIAIGLSKARRAGVPLKPPKSGGQSKETQAKAERDYEKGQEPGGHKVSRARSRGITKALKREGRAAALHSAVSRQARSAARKRTAASRSAAARKAVRTKGHAAMSEAARKGARTRARHKG